MNIHAYLNFDGTCAEAFRFYEEVLGGTIEAMTTHDDVPLDQGVGPEWQGRILHARLAVGNTVLMASDIPPGQHTRAAGFHVSINLADPAEAERIYDALSEGGTIEMPLAETFWSPKFGMFVDRYGTPWMVNCEAHA